MRTASIFILLLSLLATTLACADPPNPDVIRAHKHKRALGQRDLHRRAGTGTGASSAPAAPSSAPPPTTTSKSAPPPPPPPPPPSHTNPPPNPPANPTSKGGVTSPPTVSNPGTTAPAEPSGAPIPSIASAAPGTVPTDPFATIPLSQITSGAPAEITPALYFTPTAGSTPPVSGAPVLPSLTLVASTYPPENTVPPTNSPQVSQWMSEIAGIDPNILNISPTVDGTCANDPQAAADTSRCWWTCGGCTNSTAGVEDIVTCPDKNVWGLTFDDGPAPYTPKVLKYLNDQKLTGTFFIVGSRVMENPLMLQAEYMAGHQIGVHTWSHSIPLTALTNGEIVAELGWARQAIHEVLGVSPLYMRPPWGDIDNRVRAISLAMGMRPIIWTRNPADMAQFDTNDWRVVAGQVTGPQSFEIFQEILSNATQLNTGFIVLQHDLYEQEVDLSTGYTIPAALAAGIKPMDVNKCLHQTPDLAYLETIANKSNVPTYPGAGSVDVTGNGTGVSGTGNGTSGSTANGNGNSGGGDDQSGAALGLNVGIAAWVCLISTIATVSMIW